MAHQNRYENVKKERSIYDPKVNRDHDIFGANSTKYLNIDSKQSKRISAEFSEKVIDNQIRVSYFLINSDHITFCKWSEE